ncbi:membrane protein insertase YidC [Pseudochryseolinea flava]|uniref:Membrane protein insertase YidC n=1 Tax=Pseudochryseolinea flava TaxID=2059302 RepID=A0A364XYP4_9BACT|nr:membrane protein insertase YidC [Pseudochryseolinea flava]RAV99581.1 membrane protein insertase YidC [Pseudochryseolinea flava]
MDRNSAIGLSLIAVLLFVYFFWFSNQPQQPAQKPATTEQAPSAAAAPAETKPAVPDSATLASFGNIGSLMTGNESITTIETEDLKLAFSSHGGKIVEAELKKFKTYHKQPLKLITPTNNEFKLVTTYQGKEVDLYNLYYQPTQAKEGDTTVVTFTAALSDGSKIAHVYKIPAKGHEVGYKLDAASLAKNLSGDNLNFQWKNTMLPVEKDMKLTRSNTTVTYYQNEDGFDQLSESSTETENEVLSQPTQWIGIKEKFFLSSIIAKNAPFVSGEVQTSLNPNDTSVVKNALVKLSIPRKEVEAGKADFKFYLGPNDYQVIGGVAEDFSKNVFLGWRPVYWINKWVIFPVFHFLTQFISNYGVIIIILVLLLKLVLLPLSYKSYLSMAKMKVLKPELDEIKERVGDDMAKVQQEQMKLYQTVGVNPISGCVPVLLQMPLIFAMFFLFPNSIELRGQSLLWAEDLSTYDSLIRLPASIPFLDGHISLFTVIMTISTLIYTWQNNQVSSVTGPMKSMSYIMPVVFFFVLNSFPAGLTFYYFVSNMVTFAQQAIIKRFVDEDKIKAIMEENRKKSLSGEGPKKSKFMAKLEGAMKASEEARKKAEEERRKRKG